MFYKRSPKNVQFWATLYMSACNLTINFNLLCRTCQFNRKVYNCAKVTLTETLQMFQMAFVIALGDAFLPRDALWCKVRYCHSNPVGPIANLKGHYFQPSLSVCVCVCVSDRHFYPSSSADFDETWSQGPYSDLVWPPP